MGKIVASLVVAVVAVFSGCECASCDARDETSLLQATSKNKVSQSPIPQNKPKQPVRNWNPMCLGIIGGVGPQASADVLNKVIQLSANQPWQYQARDYPTIYSSSAAGLDGVTQNNWVWATEQEQIANIGLVLDQIRDAFPPCVLERGAFGLACNTIHAYVYEHFNGSDAFVSIIGAVADAMDEATQNVKTPKPDAWVLGSGVTMSPNGSEYKQLWGKFNVNPGFPKDQETWLWNNVIMKVQQGQEDIAKDNFKSFLKKHIKQNDTNVPVALTCTELPIAALEANGKFIPGYKFIDPNQELAKALLMRGEKRLGENAAEMEEGWKSGIRTYEQQCCSKTNPGKECNKCCESNACE